ncbi:MAG: Methicillin resistance protein [Candidatus Magasanikbacteria bacterium GW2011_GWC2_34_16]|uniref:Methicillin resistance protein n=1 Tax=Candidatus Magasanikbacteria bacterium GW2011_GWC2_34_16 TaxID=1619045 RepID=A0A0G0AQZ0_9BACT|nr:MAG: Methicillin resistance protein [Candidatus Magasanikbacteria bacterium GW2011_GWC2_34_16]
MEVKLVGQQTEWDNWLLQNDLTSSYLQSWHWGEMMERVGQKVERVQIWDNNKIVAVAQIIYKPLPFGWQYAFCPKGMVVSESRIKNQESRIYETLINYLQNKKCIFFRVEPNHLSIITSRHPCT